MARKKKVTDDEPRTFTSILNITWELKDFLTRSQKKFELQKLAMGLLSGRECIYMMLKDGRVVRVRIEEINRTKGRDGVH